jgi:hypothetical protein
VSSGFGSHTCLAESRIRVGRRNSGGTGKRLLVQLRDSEEVSSLPVGGTRPVATSRY